MLLLDAKGAELLFVEHKMLVDKEPTSAITLKSVYVSLCSTKKGSSSFIRNWISLVCCCELFVVANVAYFDAFSVFEYSSNASATFPSFTSPGCNRTR